MCIHLNVRPHTYTLKPLPVCVCISGLAACVSAARVVTHSDCEPRLLAGEAGGLEGLGEAQKQLGEASPPPVAAQTPCHNREAIKRNASPGGPPAWKTGQCHRVLLLAAIFAPFCVGRFVRRSICTAVAIFPVMNGSQSASAVAAGLARS